VQPTLGHPHRDRGQLSDLMPPRLGRRTDTCWFILRFKAEDGLHLGGWITHQRTRRANGSLSPEQIAALDNLGMVWDPSAARWETKLAAARRFRAEHGHLRVTGSFVDEDGVKLGAWVQSVRNRQDLLSREGDGSSRYGPAPLRPLRKARPR
jgi:hypothetical protein